MGKVGLFEKNNLLQKDNSKPWNICIFGSDACNIDNSKLLLALFFYKG